MKGYPSLILVSTKSVIKWENAAAFDHDHAINGSQMGLAPFITMCRV